MKNFFLTLCAARKGVLISRKLSRQEADPDDKELRGIIKTNQKARKALTYLLRPPSVDAEREQIPF
jgi:hypothetical protein